MFDKNKFNELQEEFTPIWHCPKCKATYDSEFYVESLFNATTEEEAGKIIDIKTYTPWCTNPECRCLLSREYKNSNGIIEHTKFISVTMVYSPEYELEDELINNEIKEYTYEFQFDGDNADNFYYITSSHEALNEFLEDELAAMVDDLETYHGYKNLKIDNPNADNLK